ncbi:uncharacterized protein LOC116623496 [Phoca vitulina]|uniref:uncharacterized protein LOC116623496 n=1 Tax=Phoca vitulina TaxID=9720 RepID=UPI001395DEDD|nr:uncharacterized protein LOC116623496 [Phoca vitulina]
MKKIPQMLQILDDHTEENLDQEEWEDRLLQAFLYKFFGFTLRTSRNMKLVKMMLSSILQAIHKDLQEREELIREEPLSSISSSIRLRAMNIISDFRKLRPLIEVEERTELLRTCCKSVLCLPPTEILQKEASSSQEAHTTVDLFRETLQSLLRLMETLTVEMPSRIRHCLELLDTWLNSQKDNEREWAMWCAARILGFTAKMNNFGERDQVKISATSALGYMLHQVDKYKPGLSTRREIYTFLVPLLLSILDNNTKVVKACGGALTEWTNVIGWSSLTQIFRHTTLSNHIQVLEETCKYLVSTSKIQLVGDLRSQSFGFLKSPQSFLRAAAINFIGKVLPPGDPSLFSSAGESSLTFGKG